MVLCYRELRSHDPSLELQHIYFAFLHGNSLFHVQTMLISLLHTCELNIPGLRCEQMDKTRSTHGETMYHESVGTRDKISSTVVAFLEVSVGTVREISRFETARWCFLKHVVVEKLGHITSSSNCAAMSVEALRSYRLMEAEITDLEITWRKSSKRAPAQALILGANVRLVFGSPGDPAVTWTLRDVMKTAGCGAFKDVFVLDNHLLVVKMMLQDRNHDTWAHGGAEEEQARFDKYRDILSNRMAFCYGQVYLQSSRPAGQDGILFQGISFCSQKVPHLSAANAVASITVQEKLMAVGLEKMRLLVSKQQCDAETWSEVCQEYMSMLEVLFEFMREGIFPWDAKLDNLGIAQRGVRGKWVMCDLDGLRAVGEEDKYKNLGKGMRMIFQNLVWQDHGFIDGLRANGLMRDPWHEQFLKLLDLVSTHLAHNQLGNRYSDRNRLLA